MEIDDVLRREVLDFVYERRRQRFNAASTSTLQISLGKGLLSLVTESDSVVDVIRVSIVVRCIVGLCLVWHTWLCCQSSELIEVSY